MPFMYAGDPKTQPEERQMQLRTKIKVRRDVFGTKLPVYRPSVALDGTDGILETLGLKSTISKYKSQGMSLAAIFGRFSNILSQLQRTIPQIPKGSLQSSLTKQANSLESQRKSLAPAFASGAKAGTRDEDNLDKFASGTKSLRSAVNAASKVYGIRPVPDVEQTSSVIQAGGGGLLLWGGIAAAVAFALKALSGKRN